jgi:hypothetical protein
MEFWESIKGFLVNIKGYLPGVIIMLIGLPIIYFGSRKREEKKKQNKK